MRIDTNQISNNQVELDKSAAGKVNEQSPSVQERVEDRTSLRNDAASVSSLAEKAMATPDVRQAKVDALKQQIQSGQYRLDPKEIAKAIQEKDV